MHDFYNKRLIAMQTANLLEMDMSFRRKRDRIQIIAEILNSCRSPHTSTYIRRQTNISYVVLQSCLKQMLARQWVSSIDKNGQKKFALTTKGMVFLDKWLELQKLAGLKSKRQLLYPTSEIPTVII